MFSAIQKVCKKLNQYFCGPNFREKKLTAAIFIHVFTVPLGDIKQLELFHVLTKKLFMPLLFYRLD